jgi:hypothetical protein
VLRTRTSDKGKAPSNWQKSKGKSSFTIVVAGFFALDGQSFPESGRYEPFSAVGVMAAFVPGFIGDDVIGEIFEPVIDDLMRLILAMRRSQTRHDVGEPSRFA